ncbi:MAG: mannose-6-phosphate isomerase, class I [Shewanella sp.]|uniref:mannose-6-phosphate isomerase, class I n=1 Tax=Shewanella sp. TaxID=50422 RepID=UPI003F2F1F2C
MQAFYLMKNPIQNYAWGSVTSLAQLFGIENYLQQPQAELWMGAHVNGCSMVQHDGQWLGLDKLIAQDPQAMLGARTVENFGALPFLFKVLCAEQALSVQVHPSKVQAEMGFAQENALGIPLNAANRNFKDPNHKPELVYALTDYQAMNGFRPYAEIIELFQRVNMSVLVDLVSAFAKDQNPQGLQKFFQAMLTLANQDKIAALEQLLPYAQRHSAEETFALITHLAAIYPNDIGLFAPLMLNVLTLLPGQAMYLDACTPHAYVRGTGLEVMASSDNVLRAGLTSKHIDVDELIRHTLFMPIERERMLTVAEQENGVSIFHVPASDFSFLLYEKHKHEVVMSNAKILFVLDGNAELRYENEVLILNKGQSVFIPAGIEKWQMSCSAKVAIVSNHVTGGLV